ncbi:hypothetical protein Mapa_004385 [Marchantia paleacea]|nr:hypothetical protein Mapa_004385 [Marchantia paleacea]
MQLYVLEISLQPPCNLLHLHEVESSSSKSCCKWYDLRRFFFQSHRDHQFKGSTIRMNSLLLHLNHYLRDVRNQSKIRICFGHNVVKPQVWLHVFFLHLLEKHVNLTQSSLSTQNSDNRRISPQPRTWFGPLCIDRTHGILPKTMCT